MIQYSTMELSLFRIFISIVFSLSTLCDGNQFGDEMQVTAGKEKYEAIKREAKMPKYGPCWTKALRELESDCKHLTDDIQHHLALLFTNCFLMKTGRQTYPCEKGQSIDLCTKDMAPEAYNTYTEFFTHTQNICFFLQAQVWQELTDQSITKLRDNTEFVAQRIEDSSAIQNELIRQQNLSIENQALLLEHGSKLHKTLSESTVDVNRMLLEFKSSTSEQKQMIFEVFDRVNVLQKLVMGEFTGFYSLIFYAIAILVSYLLTSTPRTSGARFWLFVLMTVNMVMERGLVMMGCNQSLDSDGHLLDENTILYYRLALCRKIFTIFAVLIWSWFAYSYRDINELNNKLLMEIQQQNSELKQLLQGQGLFSIGTIKSIRSKDNPISNDITLRNHSRPSPTQHALVESSTLDHTDNILPEIDDKHCTGYDSDSDFESSLSSTATDHTFTASITDQSSMNSSWWNRSRESTPALWEEIRDLRESTPIREMTPDDSITTNHDTSTSSSVKRGRPKGRKSAPSPMSPSPMRYNLRSRRAMNTLVENPIVETETADNFAKTVKHLAHVALRNRVKAMATVKRSEGRRSTPGILNPGLFSSDDEL